ncbi:MAG: tetratricopeptide repeat protein [Desulfobacteraceae bacterium]|nr:tetratricopeptide repeat protein [Desulfobacteraceae bacterium]
MVQEGVRKTPHVSHQWCRKGKNLLRAGAYAEALEAFEAAIQNDSRNAQAYWGRGVCRYQLGQYRMATEDMDAATLLGCRDAQLWSRFDTAGPEEGEEEGPLG